MKFKLSEQFNDDVNRSIVDSNKVSKGKIRPENIEKFNDDLNDDIGYEPIDETL